MSKNVLIISSSPRKNSNSDALAKAFMEGAKEAGIPWKKSICGMQRKSGKDNLTAVVGCASHRQRISLLAPQAGIRLDDLGSLGVVNGGEKPAPQDTYGTSSSVGSRSVTLIVGYRTIPDSRNTIGGISQPM